MLKTDNSALAGKRALVTAAARGIGAAVALKLAEHGADVAVTFEKSSEYASAVVAEIRAMGRKAVAIQADPALAESATAAVEQAVEELGGLDILVNNAGVLFAGYFSTQPLQEIDLVGGSCNELQVDRPGVRIPLRRTLSAHPDGLCEPAYHCAEPQRLAANIKRASDSLGVADVSLRQWLRHLVQLPLQASSGIVDGLAGYLVNWPFWRGEQRPAGQRQIPARIDH